MPTGIYTPEPMYSGSISRVFGGNEGEHLVSFDIESEYDIGITVTDTNGYSKITRKLPPMSFIIDILKGGKGIAFGRPATLENTFEVDFDAKFDKSIVDKFGEEIQNGLAPNINTTTEDPNTTLKQLIVTNKNTPTGQYMYIETRFLTQKALRLIAHKQLIRIVLRDHLIIVFIMVVLGVLGIELRMLVS